MIKHKSVVVNVPAHILWAAYACTSAEDIPQNSFSGTQSSTNLTSIYQGARNDIPLAKK